MHNFTLRRFSPVDAFSQSSSNDFINDRGGVAAITQVWTRLILLPAWYEEQCIYITREIFGIEVK